MFKLIVKQEVEINAYDPKTKEDLGDESGIYKLKPGEYSISKLEAYVVTNEYSCDISVDNKLIQIWFYGDTEDEKDKFTDFIDIEWR